MDELVKRHNDLFQAALKFKQSKEELLGYLNYNVTPHFFLSNHGIIEIADDPERNAKADAMRLEFTKLLHAMAAFMDEAGAGAAGYSVANLIARSFSCEVPHD